MLNTWHKCKLMRVFNRPLLGELMHNRLVVFCGQQKNLSGCPRQLHNLLNLTISNLEMVLNNPTSNKRTMKLTTKITSSNRKMLTISDLTFYSMYDGDSGGSMHALLKGAGMKSVPQPLMLEADVIVFNGGADIGTEIYGELPIPGVPLHASARDKAEMEVFQKCSDPTILKLGICRGAQLLNCLNGGTLWQDVNNHGHDHSMTLQDGSLTMPITSTHHQMMRPARGAEIIGVSRQATSKRSQLETWTKTLRAENDLDMEVVYYRDTNSLCIQGHPEYVPGSLFANWSLNLMLKCFNETHVECVA